jgi:ABC-type transport system involved in multi-copper enzyme maturation permease subunit
MSFFIALVLGIGVCHADMDPQINTFWRTRPINPDVWFWTKFVTGLTLLLVATYLPNMILALFGAATVSANMTTNPYLLAAAQIAIFASAVAITCLIRHAVYAAIITIPVVYFGIVLVWFTAWVSAHMSGHIGPRKNPLDLTEPQLAWGFLLTFVFSTLLAWLAVRNDWGRKSRY